MSGGEQDQGIARPGSSESEAVAVEAEAAAVTWSSEFTGARSTEFTMFGDLSLCRAMPSTQLLARWGRVLANNEGSTGTYAMSKRVLKIDAFLSHNWSTHRVPKFLAVAYHFNYCKAVACSLVCVLIAAALLLAGILPVTETRFWSWGQVSWWCSAACVLAFFAAMLFGHDLLHCFGLGCPRQVFLDKTCINQTDPEVQRKGIESLSAYINVSETMLIVYSDLYLQKLWTVYELASMLCLQTAPRIAVIPTLLVKVLCGLQMFPLVIVPVHLVVAATSTEASSEGALPMIIVLVEASMAPVFLVLRSWSRERAGIAYRISEFSIRQTACFVESDRPMVFRNVSVLMRDHGYVDQNAEDGDALDAFDHMAKELVPLYLQSSFGRSGLPWRVASGLAPFFVGFAFDTLCTDSSRAWRDRSVTYWVTVVLWWLVTTCALVPLALAVASWLSSRMISLQGLGNWAFLFLGWQTSALSCLGSFGGYIMVWEKAAKGGGPWWVAAFVVVSAVIVLACVIVFREVRISPKHWTEIQDRVKQQCRRFSFGGNEAEKGEAEKGLRIIGRMSL